MNNQFTEYRPAHRATPDRGEPATTQALEIPAQLGRLNFCVEQMEGALQLLGSRLEPAMSAEIPTQGPTDPSEKPPPVLTSVGSHLDAIAGRVREAQMRVERLLARLQF